MARARLQGRGACRRLPQGMTEKVDAWLMHPWLGLPLFFAFMALLFNLTYQIGTPLQDVVGAGLDWFKAAALGPWTSALPAIVQSLLLDGIWQGVSTVLTFAPILFVFFILMAMVEDSGYLARAAYLTDAFMARLGLDGRGFVMQLMGFGCNVPAILGTRVMRERKQGCSPC
jgi:ferrous iron transport protein B